MATEPPITPAEFMALSPYHRGYTVYMCGARPDQPNVPDEANPYPEDTCEHAQWEEGNFAAMLAVTDSEL